MEVNALWQNQQYLFKHSLLVLANQRIDILALQGHMEKVNKDIENFPCHFQAFLQ
jgi:hypothetical protein